MAKNDGITRSVIKGKSVIEGNSKMEINPPTLLLIQGGLFLLKQSPINLRIGSLGG